MPSSEATKLKSILNMDLGGSSGPFPDPGSGANTGSLRGLIGLYAFDEVPPSGNGSIINPSFYFKTPSMKILAKSAASELPEGKAWRAKVLEGKYIYALVFGWAGALETFRQLIQTVARELNIYSTNQLLPEWEKSVGLPDSRLEDSNPSIEVRRQNVKNRLQKSDGHYSGNATKN